MPTHTRDERETNAEGRISSRQRRAEMEAEATRGREASELRDGKKKKETEGACVDTKNYGKKNYGRRLAIARGRARARPPYVSKSPGFFLFFLLSRFVSPRGVDVSKSGRGGRVTEKKNRNKNQAFGGEGNIIASAWRRCYGKKKHI